MAAASPDACKIGGAQSMPRLDANYPLSCLPTNAKLHSSRILGTSASLPSILHFHGSYNLSKSAPPLKESFQPVKILRKIQIDPNRVSTFCVPTYDQSKSSQKSPVKSVKIESSVAKKKFKVGFKKKGPAPKPPRSKCDEQLQSESSASTNFIMEPFNLAGSMSEAQREIAAMNNSCLVDTRIRMFEQQITQSSSPQDAEDLSRISEPDIGSVRSLDTSSPSEFGYNIDSHSLDNQSDLNLNISNMIPDGDDYKLVFISSSGSSKSSGLDQLTDSMDSSIDGAGIAPLVTFSPRISTTLRQCEGDGAIFWEDSDWEFHSDTDIFDQLSTQSCYSWDDSASAIVSLDRSSVSIKQLMGKKSLSLEVLPSLNTLNDFSPTRSIEEIECSDQILNSSSCVPESPIEGEVLPKSDPKTPLQVSKSKTTYIFGCDISSNDNSASNQSKPVLINKPYHSGDTIICESPDCATQSTENSCLLLQDESDKDIQQLLGHKDGDGTPTSLVSEEDPSSDQSCKYNALATLSSSCVYNDDAVRGSSGQDSPKNGTDITPNRIANDFKMKFLPEGNFQGLGIVAANRSVREGEQDCVSSSTHVVLQSHNTAPLKSETETENGENPEVSLGVKQSFLLEDVSFTCSEVAVSNVLPSTSKHTCVVSKSTNLNHDQTNEGGGDHIVQEFGSLSVNVRMETETDSPNLCVDQLKCDDPDLERELSGQRESSPTVSTSLNSDSNQVILSTDSCEEQSSELSDVVDLTDLISVSKLVLVDSTSFEDIPDESSILEDYFKYTLESENSRKKANKLPEVKLNRSIHFNEVEEEGLSSSRLDPQVEEESDDPESSTTSSSDEDEEVVYDLYDRPDYSLHTIMEESCEESEKSRPQSPSVNSDPSDLEKYFSFAISGHNIMAGNEVSDTMSEISNSSSLHEEMSDAESIDLAPESLEKYFMNGLVGSFQSSELSMADESDLASETDDCSISNCSSRRGSACFVMTDTTRSDYDSSTDSSDSSETSGDVDGKANEIPFERSEGFDTVKRKKKNRKVSKEKEAYSDISDEDSFMNSKNVLSLTPRSLQSFHANDTDKFLLGSEGMMHGVELLSVDINLLDDSVVDVVRCLVDNVCKLQDDQSEKENEHYLVGIKAIEEVCLDDCDQSDGSETCDVIVNDILNNILNSVCESSDKAFELSSNLTNLASTDVKSPKKSFEYDTVDCECIEVMNVCPSPEVPEKFSDFSSSPIFQFAEKITEELLTSAFAIIVRDDFSKQRTFLVSNYCDKLIENMFTDIFDEAIISCKNCTLIPPSVVAFENKSTLYDKSIIEFCSEMSDQIINNAFCEIIASNDTTNSNNHLHTIIADELANVIIEDVWQFLKFEYSNKVVSVQNEDDHQLPSSERVDITSSIEEDIFHHVTLNEVTESKDNSSNHLDNADIDNESAVSSESDVCDDLVTSVVDHQLPNSEHVDITSSIEEDIFHHVILNEVTEGKDDSSNQLDNADIDNESAVSSESDVCDDPVTSVVDHQLPNSERVDITSSNEEDIFHNLTLNEVTESKDDSSNHLDNADIDNESTVSSESDACDDPVTSVVDHQLPNSECVDITSSIDEDIFHHVILNEVTESKGDSSNHLDNADIDNESAVSSESDVCVDPVTSVVDHQLPNSERVDITSSIEEDIFHHLTLNEVTENKDDSSNHLDNADIDNESAVSSESDVCDDPVDITSSIDEDISHHVILNEVTESKDDSSNHLDNADINNESAVLSKGDVYDDPVTSVVSDLLSDLCAEVSEQVDNSKSEQAVTPDRDKDCNRKGSTSSEDEAIFIFNKVMSHISCLSATSNDEHGHDSQFNFLENQIKQLMKSVSPFASTAGSTTSEDVSSCTSSTLETSSVSSDYGSDTDTLESSDVEECPTPENCATPTPTDVPSPGAEQSQCSSEALEIYQQVMSSLSKIRTNANIENKADTVTSAINESDVDNAGDYISSQIKMLMMSVSGSDGSNSLANTPESKRRDFINSSHCSELDSELVSDGKVKHGPRSIDSRSSQDTRTETCSETCSIVSTSSISFEVEDSEGTTESDDPKPSECDVILSIIDDLAKQGKDVLASDNNDHSFLPMYLESNSGANGGSTVLSETPESHFELNSSVLQKYNSESLSHHQPVNIIRKQDRRESSLDTAVRLKASLEVHNSTESLSDIPEESENSQSEDEYEENKRSSVIWVDESSSRLKDPIRDSTTSLSSKDSRNTRDSSTSLSSSKESFVTVISPSDLPPTRKYLSKSDSHSYPALPVSRKYLYSEHDIHRYYTINKSHSALQIDCDVSSKPRRRARKTGAVKQALADLISPNHHRRHSTQMWVESIQMRQKEMMARDEEPMNTAKMLSSKAKASSENNLLVALSTDDTSPVISTKSTGHIPDLAQTKQAFRDTGYYSLKSSGESIPSIGISSSSASSMSDHIPSAARASPQQVVSAVSMQNIAESSVHSTNTLPSPRSSLSCAESFSSPNIPSDVSNLSIGKSTTLPIKSRLTKHGPPNTRSSSRAFLSAAGIVGRLKSSFLRSKSNLELATRSHNVSKKIRRHVSDSDTEENDKNYSLGLDNAAKNVNDTCFSSGNSTEAAVPNQDCHDSKKIIRRPGPIHRQFSLESHPLVNWRPVLKRSVINSLNSESYGSIPSLTMHHDSTRIQSAPNIPRHVTFTSLSNIHDEQNKSGSPHSSKLTLASQANQETQKSGEGSVPQISVSEYTDNRSESMTSVYSAAGGGRYGTVTVTGEIRFKLSYNYRAGAMEIHIHECKDLAPVDTKRNRSDPYVKAYLLPDKTKSGKRKTKVKKHTLNPMFEEVLKFHVTISELETRTLWLTVWHSDMFGRNDFLGEVMLPLGYQIFDKQEAKWYSLQERYIDDIINDDDIDDIFLLFQHKNHVHQYFSYINQQHPNITFSLETESNNKFTLDVLIEPNESPITYKGDLIVALRFIALEASAHNNEETKGRLHLLIKEARNLMATRANGTSDPFCKSYLLPEKSKVFKQKTHVIKKNCNPHWNQEFIYENLSLSDLKDRCLELTIWDYDKITSNDFLGGVRLSLGTGRYRSRDVDWMDSKNEEQRIWQEMLDKPNQWLYNLTRFLFTGSVHDIDNN
ncbi:Synaptotagmin-like protein 5 [Nymphon striatum]|nr:Synaptotagmin-like protein 5 [Nymphon striatum]